MKIVVIGYSGAGKSTLARRLGDYYQIPVLHLDNVAFYGDWSRRSLEEKNQILQQFMKENRKGWVMDGNYYNCISERFEECEQIFFLDYNRVFCYFSVLRRYLKNKGRTRESCPCIEKFDFEFQKWILLDGRTRKIKDKHEQHFIRGKERHRFKNRRQLNRYLKKAAII